MSTGAVGEVETVQYQNLRAAPSITRSFARFVNSTFRQIDVLWINFQGVPVRYAVLEEKGSWIDINTFVGHSWLFRDSSNGLPLICLPQKTYVFLPEVVDARSLSRKVIKITIPVFSLKLRCLEVLKNKCETHERAERLEIPNSLKNDLHALFSDTESYRLQRTSMSVPTVNNNNQ